MDIFRIGALAIVATLLLVLLRKDRPEMALGLSLVAGFALFFAMLPALSGVVGAFSELAQEAGVGPVYFGVILKVLAVAYIADFAAAICRDAGEDLMAQRAEMAGKLLILLASLPIIQGVLDLIKSLLGS